VIPGTLKRSGVIGAATLIVLQSNPVSATEPVRSVDIVESSAFLEGYRAASEAQSADFDAALVLILANHIGDIEVLREAITLAKRRAIDAQQQQQQQQQQQ